MKRQQNDGIHWYQFDLFERHPNIVHGSFLRHGGVSQGPYASLNIAYGVGDEKAHVAENRRHLMEAFGGDLEFHDANQVHGVTTTEVDGNSPETLPDCDALITNVPEHALVIKHADCQAALFYDPIHNAIAAVHSGWRGSVQNIYHATIAAMGGKYGTLPSDLLVAVSPSLGPEASEFTNYKEELPQAFWDCRIDDTHFDFWEITRRQLMEGGVKHDNIEIAGICTYDNPEDYYSYRRDHTTGRHATLIALVE